MKKGGNIDFFYVFVNYQWNVKGAIIFIDELAHEMS